MDYSLLQLSSLLHTHSVFHDDRVCAIGLITTCPVTRMSTERKSVCLFCRVDDLGRKARGDATITDAEANATQPSP